MKILKIENLKDFHKNKIFELWNKEYPKNLAFDSISALYEYLNSLQNSIHYLVENEDNTIIGWATVFDREEKRWFVIILDSHFKGKKIGTKILTELKNNENQLYGWVIDHNNYKKLNGETYTSPLNFYMKNDFIYFCDDRLELDFLSAAKIKWEKLDNQIPL